MMFSTTTITNTANRKRSRQTLQQQGPSAVVTMPMTFFAMTLLLVISQASAFDGASSALRNAVEISNASVKSGNIEHFDNHGSNDLQGDGIGDEDRWTPEEHVLMDHIYNRYIQEIVEKYGPNWEDEYELDVDKEELYEEYLMFEDQEQKLLEEKRRLTQASHNVLLEYDGSINAEKKDDGFNPQNRTEEQSSGVRGSKTGCDTPTPTPTAIITTRSGNTRNMVGPI